MNSELLDFHDPSFPPAPTRRPPPRQTGKILAMMALAMGPALVVGVVVFVLSRHPVIPATPILAAPTPVAKPKKLKSKPPQLEAVVAKPKLTAKASPPAGPPALVPSNVDLLRLRDREFLATIRQGTKKEKEEALLKLIHSLAPYKAKDPLDCTPEESIQLAILYARLASLIGKQEPQLGFNFIAAAQRHANHGGIQEREWLPWFERIVDETQTAWIGRPVPQNAGGDSALTKQRALIADGKNKFGESLSSKLIKEKFAARAAAVAFFESAVSATDPRDRESLVLRGDASYWLSNVRLRQNKYQADLESAADSWRAGGLADAAEHRMALFKEINAFRAQKLGFKQTPERRTTASQDFEEAKRAFRQANFDKAESLFLIGARKKESCLLAGDAFLWADAARKFRTQGVIIGWRRSDLPEVVKNWGLAGLDGKQMNDRFKLIVAEIRGRKDEYEAAQKKAKEVAERAGAQKVAEAKERKEFMKTKEGKEEEARRRYKIAMGFIRDAREADRKGEPTERTLGFATRRLEEIAASFPDTTHARLAADVLKEIKNGTWR